MARLLRLHLTCVGHKDARFFPLTLDFRDRGQRATDCVVWLMNGGGKSSLMNLFYSAFLPESRRFLGAKEGNRERKLPDYIKGGDVAVVLTEWQMPAGPNLFSPTRIVGQVLAWKGGVATPDDESRLEREFFTFRGSDLHPFATLPFHGLGAEPLLTLKDIREWLARLANDYPALEVERGDEGGKGKWRATLDRVGLDTELFDYHLKMNVREGGAAELFKVKDTMEFVDLFLEMALNPDQADMAKEQIEKVREKLMRLPQKESEERFALAMLEQLRPLAGEAEAFRAAEGAWRDQRRANYLLRAAIESSIATNQARLTLATNELAAVQETRGTVQKQKNARVEYRRNYHNLACELTYKEAAAAVAIAVAALQQAERDRSLAAAAVRFAKISGKQRELDELRRAREAQLTEQKPVLAELHGLGAAYHACLGAEIERIEELLTGANDTLKQDSERYSAAVQKQQALRDEQVRTATELESVKNRIKQRDQRREALQEKQHLRPNEKAAAAMSRWEEEQRRIERAIVEAEGRVEVIDAELAACGEQIADLSTRRRDFMQRAGDGDKQWQRGNAAAESLRKEAPICEVLTTETPNLDFPDLSHLLHTRLQHLDDAALQNRLGRVDDERTLRSFDSERLFPPTREVELVLSRLRDLGVRTALPAYRYLATNAKLSATARNWLARDPARFSGIVINSEDEFLALKSGDLSVPGLRHPVQVTLSGNPDSNERLGAVVALPASDGAYNHEAAATDRNDVETRVGKAEEQLTGILERRAETARVIQELAQWRGEFGGGALDRIAAERDHANGEDARLAEQITTVQGEATTLRNERVTKLAELKGLRPDLVTLTQRQESLRSYHDEYEVHEEHWLEERRSKLGRIEELKGEIAEQGREVDRCHAEVKQREDRVRSLGAEKTQREEQQEAIRFHKSVAPSEVLPLETCKVRYEQALARYEERFGQSKLDGQIEQAEANLVELRREHRGASEGLTDEEVSEASKAVDLQGQLGLSESAHLRANSAHDAAVQRLQTAERERPEVPAHKQGLGLPPEMPKPETAEQAKQRRAELDVEIESDNARLAECDAQVTAKSTEEQALKATIGARTPHLTTLDDLVEEASGAMPSLPSDDQELTNVVSTAKRTTEKLGSKRADAQQTVDNRIERLRNATRREEFATIPALARDRLGNLPPSEVMERCGELIQSYEAWQKVVRHEIETLDTDKDLVVRALDGVAASAARLLAKADRASIMPEAFPGWTGEPFLRITAQPLVEPAARRDRLAGLVAKLVAEKAIPSGHRLASAALREVGGHIRVTLLKPEDPLRPDRHDITEFGTFSGGEKMTAAILLYATLAQLRIRDREEHTRDREAGVLLLDNPFGTASKREFVELQLRVARQMGVQLIYTTGVNDLGALDVLPRILRLRKRHRDRRSGDLLISQEAPAERLESVQANLR